MPRERSTCLPEREIDATAAEERMLAIREWRHAVVVEARGTAPHHDVAVVWGGPSRLNYHGVAPLADGEHPLLGRRRVNLTFRKAR